MSHQRKIVLMGQGLGVGQHDNGLGCYSALEKLKRTADKLIFDQETTVNNMKQYKDKLQVAEQEVLVLSEQLRVQRNENAKLKAQTQDDQRQINYVSDKVKIVQTLYENMESIVNKLKMETNQNEAYYEALAQNLKTKTSYCEIFVADVESLQNEYQSAISEIKIKESLIVSLEEQVIKIQKAVDQEQLLKNDALSNVQHLEAQQKRLNSEIMSIKDQYDKLQTKMHEDRNEFMQNELNLREQIGVLQKNIQQLEQKEIQLKNQITQLEDELEHAFRKHQSDDTTIIGLRKERDALQQNLKDSRAHLKSSTAQILSLKCKVEELRKGIKDGEICLEDTRSKLDLLNKKYEEVSNEQKESQLSLAEHREQEEQLELTLYKIQFDAQEKLQQYSILVTRLENDKKELAAKIQQTEFQYEEKLQQLNQAKQNLELEIQKLKMETQQNQSLAENRMKDIQEDNKKEINEAVKKVKEEETSRLNAVLEQLDKVKSENEGLQTCLEVQKGEQNKLQQDHCKTKQEYSEQLDKLRKEFQEKLDERQKLLREEQQNHASVNEQLKDVTAQLDDCKDQLNKIQSQYLELQSNHEKFIHVSNCKIQELKLKNETELAEISLAHENNITSLTQQLEEVEKQHLQQFESMARDIERYKDESEEMRRNLKYKQDELDMSEARMNELQAKLHRAELELQKKESVLRNISDKITLKQKGNA
eukprot:TRINITY_DN1306_c0_g1_i5.p1 TRINITY_DN1306_c0_g1~~TRINITY_DN1306_c0_g1_i5.p1  ORF type:complete len:706 (+),score=101.35 TRINITY_DN1306_c0_g1_i5:243-2360(+)